MQNTDNTEPQDKSNTTEGFNTDINTDNTAENTQTSAETSTVENTQTSEQKIAELNDKYLRLYSEFDNYRKRTIKEKLDIIKTASEDVFKAILPVIDDFDRAEKANQTIEDVVAIKEGITLIHTKLKNSMQQKGLTAFESIGTTFNADIMEAITHIPSTDESQKNKVIDEVEKGYKLGDKVIRFAKVIIAQ